jgi:LacI family transcriptional regulator
MTRIKPGDLAARSYVRTHHRWSVYHEPHGLTESFPRWLRRWDGDGIIARIQTRHMAREIAATGIPTVDVLGVVPNLPFPVVHVDDHEIARLASQHMLEHGLRHFGFFGIEDENWSDQRYAAFCAALAPVQSSVPLYKLPRDSRGQRSWERTEDKLARWILALPKPVGILVCSDQRGPIFLEACGRAGVRVPEEVAVLGIDDDEPLCEICDPPLASVRPGHIRVGYEAAALLERMIQGDRAPKSARAIPPEGVVARRSLDNLSVGNRVVASAIRLIRERAHQGLQVDAIARHVNVSRSVLQRSFRTVMRRSVYQEILATRIRHARELLIHTNLPLAAVAEQTGFKHQEYMGSVLKAHLGTTPAQLRRSASLGRPSHA